MTVGSFIVTLLAVFMPVGDDLGCRHGDARQPRHARGKRAPADRDRCDPADLCHPATARGQHHEPASVARSLDEIAETAKKTETVRWPRFSTKRARPARAAAPNANRPTRPRWNLGRRPRTSRRRSATDIFIRALNFPETQDDAEGFDALRLALKDRKTAQLVQASQDVLTLLSQEGIYMDDLRPDMARPEIWRQFAQGARGRFGGGFGRHSGPVVAGADGGADETGPDLSRCRTSLPAPL